MTETLAGAITFWVAFLAINGLILWSIADTLIRDWREWCRTRSGKNNSEVPRG